MIQIFTDGACEPNPGPGAWAAIVRLPETPDIELTGFDAWTTNNRMELLGPISGLEHIPKQCADVQLISDSQYVVNGITLWIIGWKKNGWRTTARREVVNKDLWLRLDELNSRHKVVWQWVRGHAGHVENERADELAMNALALGQKTASTYFK